jgi:hypothetical protein
MPGVRLRRCSTKLFGVGVGIDNCGDFGQSGCGGIELRSQAVEDLVGAAAFQGCDECADAGEFGALRQPDPYSAVCWAVAAATIAA